MSCELRVARYGLGGARSELQVNKKDVYAAFNTQRETRNPHLRVCSIIPILHYSMDAEKPLPSIT